VNGRRLVSAAAVVLAVALFTGASAPDPLLEAARRGDVAAVRSLLRSGADPNVALGDGLTALHLAAEAGNLELVSVLIDAKARLDARTRIGDYTPLHLAAGSAHEPVVRALLGAGADPRVVTSSSGATPLHLAARAMSGEGTIRALLEKGADVNALESAYGQTPLMFAASYGRSASVRELMRGGADPSLRTRVVDVLRSMALDQAAEEHLQEAIKQIRGETPDGTDRELTTAEVHQAIAAQREFLRSESARTEALAGYHPDNLGRMGAYWDTPTGQKSQLQVFLRPRWETWVGITGGMTALMYAAREGQVAAAVALLDGGADIDETSGDGTTPLVEALLNGQFELAMMLIERGADVNLATHTDGVSPLFAVLQTQWASKFTESYSQPRAHDNQSVQYMEVLNALLERGANPNVRLRTHLWYWEHVDGPTSKMGLDITGATPFWRAAFAQDVDAMKALVAHGADPNIPTIWPDPGLRNGVGGSGR
jgi:ankyrin repeat protein